MSEQLILDAKIPLPIQLVIDDVGWLSGLDGHLMQEPYRTGMHRDHVLEDYMAIIRLGMGLKMRPQAAMILCDWDRDNLLSDLPHATWMGKKWKTPVENAAICEKIAALLDENAHHIELALHGLAHEYWDHGVLHRSEWHDNQGQMRPVESIKKHLEYFAKIWDRNELGDFPTAFVPTAFLHRFGLGESGIAPLLKAAGIQSLSTPFASMHCARKPRFSGFDFDAGLFTHDRGSELFPWNKTDTVPIAPLQGPVCGLHWANLLHEDPRMNDVIVQRWIHYLRPYGQRINTMLAPDTPSFLGQLRFHAWGKVRFDKRNIYISNDRFAQKYGLGDVLFLRCWSRVPTCFESDDLEITCFSPVVQDRHLLYELAVRIPESATKLTIESHPIGA